MKKVLSRPAARVLALLAAAWLTAAGPDAGAVAAPQQNQRTVVVSVLGRNDVAVPDLTVKDFTVREDGAVREVVRVAQAAPPANIVLLADDSQAATSFARDLRDSLTAFANTMADQVPAPAIRLTTFGNRPTVIVDFTPAFSAVSRGIDRIAPQTGSGAMMLDAIMETCRDLRSRKTEGAVLVAFIAEGGPEFSDVEHTRVADALRGVRASLWTISQPDRNGGAAEDGPARERASVIGDVTAQSGGRNTIVFAAQNLPPAFRALADTLLARYEVTYGRPEALVPPTRLEVTGRDRGWKLQVTKWAAR